MKFDKDLVREILLAVEAVQQDPRQWIDLEMPARDARTVAHHVMLLHEAGLLDAADVSSMGHFDWRPKRLTYEGHEFLNTIRDGKVWNLTKTAADRVGGASLALLGEIAKAQIKLLLGLP